MSSLINETQNVYKRIPGESNENKPIRKVRGLYVTGQYLPIEYENNLLNITRVVCTPSKSVDYIERNVSNSTDSIFNVHDLSFTKSTIVNFYQNTEVINNTTKGSVFTVYDIELDHKPIIVAYATINLPIKRSDSIFTVCDIDLGHIPEIEDFKIRKAYIGRESALMIRRYTIDTAAVTDVL